MMRLRRAFRTWRWLRHDFGVVDGWRRAWALAGPEGEPVPAEPQ